MTLDQSDELAQMAASHLMRTPRKLNIDITSHCNLRCRYCYFFSNPQVEYRDLPAEEWLQFFDELGRLGVMDVVLAGGEPFTRQDLPVLLESLVHNRMRFALLSNGALIDDEIAAFLARTGRCNYVQVSLDGSNPETHDACRGKGSFEGALRGIRTLQRHSVPVAVRFTIHRHNFQDIENTAYLLLNELGLPGFSVNSAGYLGACRLHADDVLLTTAERQHAIQTMLRLVEKYGPRISASAGPLAEGRMWKKMETARLQGAAPFSNGGHLTACGCPFAEISVRSDGIIVPCTMLAHIELGRINQDPLAEVWRSSPALNHLRSRSEILLADFDFCAGCEYIPYCTGNCPGLAYSLTGQVNHPSPDACLRRFLADGGSLENL